MANQRSGKTGGAQGTGKHPHKSTEEPDPHTREEGTEHSGSAESRNQASGGQSSGSHSSSEHSSGGGHASSEKHGGSQSHEGSRGSDDLKEREYRDSEGNIHHHTRTSSAMQGEDETEEE